MAEPSFPRQDHKDYLETRARTKVSQRPSLRFVDIVEGFHARTYEVGVEKLGSTLVERLPIHFQVIERCLGKGSDQELLQCLDVLLEQKFPG